MLHLFLNMFLSDGWQDGMTDFMHSDGCEAAIRESLYRQKQSQAKVTFRDAEALEICLQYTSMVFLPVRHVEARQHTDREHKVCQSVTNPEHLQDDVNNNYGTDSIAYVIKQLSKR